MKRITLGLSKRSPQNLIIFAHGVHDCMLAEAAVFTAPTVPMADFLPLINALQLAQQEMQGGGTNQRVIRDARRKTVEDALKKLANYVETVADGDTEIIQSAGFEPRKERGVSPDTLEMPKGLEINLVMEGVVRMRWKGVKGAGVYLVQYSLDPSSEAGWMQAYNNTSTSAELGGLTPGKKYAFRVQAVGRANLRSAWSNIVTQYIV